MNLTEMIKCGINHLSGLDVGCIGTMIQREIDAAGGLLTEDAAAHLVADKLGFYIDNHKMRAHGAWIYTFVLSRKNGGNRTEGQS